MSLSAQGDDLGAMFSAEAVKKFGKLTTLGMQSELRLNDDLSHLDRLSVSLQATHKVQPWLKASAQFTVIGDNNRRISHYKEGDRDVVKGLAKVGDRKNLREYWGLRLRMNAGLTASQKFGRVKLSLREWWQYTYRPHRFIDGRYNYLYQKSDNTPHVYHGKAKHELRSRLKAEYHKKKHWLTPYASIECFNAWEVEKLRYTIGSEMKLSNASTVEVFYRFQDRSDNSNIDNHPDRHFLGLAYQLNF